MTEAPDHPYHWLRLTLTEGVGGESARKLLKAFGLPGNIFATNRSALSKHVSAGVAERLLAPCSEQMGEEIERTLQWSKVSGNHIVTLADASYPQALLTIADPPPLLYAKGNLSLFNKTSLAVVGSRNATPQGMANAEQFSTAFSAANVAIVSGMALGIDAAAHRGGLAGPGSTIAVIGTGADIIYPARNRDLAYRIAESGLIVSEFPLGTPAIAANFPRRNRIISGLVRGVLVVEAATQSGSLITARMAGEQGREVFAIPGSIHSPLSRGCHQLIKQGAKLVESAADVMDELGTWHTPAQPAPDAVQEDTPEGQILTALGHDLCDVDTLAARVGLTTDVLSAMLLQMELNGQVASMPGSRFQRLD